MLIPIADKINEQPQIAKIETQWRESKLSAHKMVLTGSI